MNRHLHSNYLFGILLAAVTAWLPHASGAAQKQPPEESCEMTLAEFKEWAHTRVQDPETQCGVVASEMEIYKCTANTGEWIGWWPKTNGQPNPHVYAWATTGEEHLASDCSYSSHCSYSSFPFSVEGDVKSIEDLSIVKSYFQVVPPPPPNDCEMTLAEFKEWAHTRVPETQCENYLSGYKCSTTTGFASIEWYPSNKGQPNPWVSAKLTNYEQEYLSSDCSYVPTSGITVEGSDVKSIEDLSIVKSYFQVLPSAPGDGDGGGDQPGPSSANDCAMTRAEFEDWAHTRVPETQCENYLSGYKCSTTTGFASIEWNPGEPEPYILGQIGDSIQLLDDDCGSKCWQWSEPCPEVKNLEDMEVVKSYFNQVLPPGDGDGGGDQPGSNPGPSDGGDGGGDQPGSNPGPSDGGDGGGDQPGSNPGPSPGTGSSPGENVPVKGTITLQEKPITPDQAAKIDKVPDYCNDKTDSFTDPNDPDDKQYTCEEVAALLPAKMVPVCNSRAARGHCNTVCNRRKCRCANWKGDIDMGTGGNGRYKKCSEITLLDSVQRDNYCRGPIVRLCPGSCRKHCRDKALNP